MVTLPLFDYSPSGTSDWPHCQPRGGVRRGCDGSILDTCMMASVTSLSVVQEAPTVVTVGYEGRSAEELVDALLLEAVDVVADVRLTPLSRKPGLSKRRLAAALASVGIDYVHLPALGNPKDNRDAYRAGDEASRDRFASLLDEDDARSALQRLNDLLPHNRVALLCFERDPATCHRELVGAELVRRLPQLRVAHT